MNSKNMKLTEECVYRIIIDNYNMYANKNKAII